MGYPMGYLISNRIIPSHDMIEKRFDIIFLKKYKIFINRYYITV